MKQFLTSFLHFAPDNGSGMHRLWTDNGPIKSRKLFALLFCLLFVGVGNAWGANVTLTFTTDAGRAAFTPDLPTPSKANSTSVLTVGTNYTNSSISISVTKGSSSNTPSIFWKSGTSTSDGNTDLRIYRQASSGSNLSGNTITISSSYTITAMTINGSSLGGLTTSTGTSGGTASAKTWSGSATSITYTNTSTSNIPITSIVVTYSTGGGCTNGTITYSAGSTTYTGGNAISGSHSSDTKVCSTSLTLPGATFTTTGYTQDGWATSDGGSKVYNLGATNYSTEGDATLYPHWSANNYTVTWMCNGSQHTTTSVAYGSKPTFPSNPSSCDGTSTTFIGWTQTPWSGKIDDISGLTTDATKVYTEASQMPNVTADVTYHAVFAKGTANTYKKGTKADLTDGQTVLIVNPSASVALKGDKSAQSVTITSNKITTASTAVLWTVEPHGSGYYFKYGNNYLNAGTSSIYVDGDTDEWSVSGSGPYVITSGNQSTKSLQYYNSAWKMYNTDNNSYFQMDFYIPDYSQYLTTCCTALGSINGSFF